MNVASHHLASVALGEQLRCAYSLCLAALSLSLCSTGLVRGDTSITVLPHPPDTSRNSFYLTNRPPLKAEKLVKLPIGKVKPRGWLLEIMRRQQEGLAGRLPEVSAWLQKDGNAWLARDGRGKWGWEEVPYWLRGAILMAQILDDRELVTETEDWIRSVLNSRRPGGQFGPLRVFGDDGSPDLWANMVMLACLQSYYEYSNDPAVLELMSEYFRFQAALPDEKMFTHYWQYYRGGDNLESVYWLFNRTGDDWLLDLAEKVHRNTADWRMDRDLPSWHGVNIAQAFGEPATYYLQSKDPADLRAAYDNFKLARDRFGQFPGGMFAADENARSGYVDPRQAIETCAVVEQIRSDQQLLATTGDTFWADNIEDIAFNTFPAALAPDYRSLRYLTSPNLVSSDSRNYAPGIENIGPMFTFNPLSHRCCQHNHAQGWPRFVEHLWMATQDNGLCAAYYGPCIVEATVGNGIGVRIEELTRYPFEEQINLTISPESKAIFPIYLRIPSWSEGSSVAVNGELVAENVSPSTYVKIRRLWSSGDEVVISLPMEIVVHRWERNQNSVSISRGPLSYSLSIEAERVEVDPIDTVAVDSQWSEQVQVDDWPAYELHPTTPWNYGLSLDRQPLEKNFSFKQRAWPDSDYPFSPDSTPVAISCRGRKISEWTHDQTGLCGRLQPSPVYSSNSIDVLSLIPMGAASLRISAFPEVSNDRGLPRWKTISNVELSYQPTASHCAVNDSVEAIADGLLPCASNDQSIPRHTFLPRVGTKEWLQADFEAPRLADRVEVYWCDDSSRFDHAPTGPYISHTKTTDCRAPQSWRLLYQDGDLWRPVITDDSYGVATNQFNVLSFQEVNASAFRIELVLSESASAGVLEWRIIDSARKASAVGEARGDADTEDASPRISVASPDPSPSR